MSEIPSRLSLGQKVDGLMWHWSVADFEGIEKECRKSGKTPLELAKEYASDGRYERTYSALKVHNKEIDSFGVIILREAFSESFKKVWCWAKKFNDQVEAGNRSDAVLYWHAQLMVKAASMDSLVNTFTYLIDEHRYDYRGKKA